MGGGASKGSRSLRSHRVPSQLGAPHASQPNSIGPQHTPLPPALHSTGTVTQPPQGRRHKQAPVDSTVPPPQHSLDVQSDVPHTAPVLRPQTASGHDLKYLAAETQDERLGAYCRYIFGRADGDEDGLLDGDEFAALVQSDTLGLEIYDDDIDRMMAEYDNTHGGRALGFADFSRVMLDLMRLHSQRLRAEGCTGWEWFPMYFDDEPDSLPLYYHTERRLMTYDRPQGIEYRSRLHDDEQEFQTMVRGTTGDLYTTLVDEVGVRRWVAQVIRFFLILIFFFPFGSCFLLLFLTIIIKQRTHSFCFGGG